MAGPAPLPLSVVMISLNEGHNMRAVLANLDGFAEHVFLVDSLSADDTVEIALAQGVHVVQRRFRDFGDQWNWALDNLPIETPWTMKLDPDERLTEALKDNIRAALAQGAAEGYGFDRRLYLMGAPLPVLQFVPRIWRTGRCRFTDVIVNEHPVIEGRVVKLPGQLAHHDSPNLHHWYDKQNAYLTAEAVAQFRGAALADRPRLFGSALQRKMWLKRVFWRVPGRYAILFWYHALWLGAWRAGRVGWIWSRLRTELYRSQEFKLYEMRRMGREYAPLPSGIGAPHPGAIQADDPDKDPPRRTHPEKDTSHDR